MQPYLPNPRTGWRRIRRGLLVAAVILFCLPYGFFFALFAPYLMPPFAVPLLILAAVAIWALPELPRAPTRTLERLFWVFPVALLLWPNYLAIALPGLPWITLIRLVDFPLALTLLISVSVSGKFRARAAQALKGAPLVWMFVTGFAVIQVLTIVVSKHPVGSLQKVFNEGAAWIAMFFASAFVFRKPGRIQAFGAVMWASALIIGGIGLWENHLHHVPWAGHIPSFLKVQDETVARILAGSYRQDSGQYRVQSTFTTPLGLSEYMALTLAFVLQFAIGRYPWIVRCLAAASAPFMLYIILLTDARLGLIGGGVTLALFVLYWGARQWRHVTQSLLGPGTVLAYPALAVAMVASVFFVHRIHNMFFGGQYEASNEGRTEMYKQGIALILKHPWGYGAGNAAQTLGITNPSGLLTIDTYYIAVGLDYGVLGFVCYYGALIAAVYYAGREAFLNPNKRRDILFLGALATSLTSFIVIKSVFSEEGNHPLAFMMMGAIAALCARLKKTEASSSTSAAGASLTRDVVWERPARELPAFGRTALPAQPHQPPR